MKGSKRLFALGLSALVLVCLACTTNVFAADETMIIGTVYAAAWDKDDNVISATIVTATGEEYVIVDNAVGKDLLKLDNKVVKASGVVGEQTEGNRALTVTSYEIMPE